MIQNIFYCLLSRVLQSVANRKKPYAELKRHRKKRQIVKQTLYYQNNTNFSSTLSKNFTLTQTSFAVTITDIKLTSCQKAAASFDATAFLNSIILLFPMVAVIIFCKKRTSLFSVFFNNDRNSRFLRRAQIKGIAPVNTIPNGSGVGSRARTGGLALRRRTLISN